MRSFSRNDKHVTPTKVDSKILTNAAWMDLLVCDLILSLSTICFD